MTAWERDTYNNWRYVVDDPGLQRYCLSPRAAQGVLNRSERRGKRLPEPLAASLRVVAREQTRTA